MHGFTIRPLPVIGMWSGWALVGMAIGPSMGPVPGVSPGTEAHALPRRDPSLWCDSVRVPATPPSSPRQVMVVACGVTPAESLPRRNALAVVARALLVYARLTGVPYPGTRYVMQFEPGSEGARTAQGGFVSFSLSLPDTVAAHDRPAATAKILAHELAHQWGSRFRGTGPDAGWLGEGFADFLTAQVWGTTPGGHGEEEFLFFYNTQWDDGYGQTPAINDRRMAFAGWPYGWFSLPWPGAQIWNESIDKDNYYRGALVLWMLQQYLGDTRFWAVMHAYLTDRTLPPDANAAFLQAIQHVTGEDLSWFFHEWVHGRRYPRFTVAAAYDAAAQRVTLQVTQATPVFRMPVTIRVGTPRGDVLAHALVDAPTQTLVVEHVTQPPTSVVFDDGDALVKTVEFPQPTAWLVAQVQREARPWQTWWAIEQLRGRAAHDPVAATALVTTARHGHDALTRAQALVALRALGSAPAPAAVAALTAGVRDTAVIVRRAAVQGLAAIGTAAAQALEQEVVAHDPSDLVRAEALQQLLLAPRTPPATRQTLFAQALRGPPSYLDLVPTAAIKALALTNQCDSLTLGTLRAALAAPAVVAPLQRVTDQLTLVWPMLDPSADPTCLQTFAAQLPLPSAAPGTAP